MEVKNIRPFLVTLNQFVKDAVPFNKKVPDDLSGPVRLKTKMDFIMMLDSPVKINSVYDYISELKNKFPKIMKRIQLVTITDELKLEFFPEEY